MTRRLQVWGDRSSPLTKALLDWLTAHRLAFVVVSADPTTPSREDYQDQPPQNPWCFDRDSGKCWRGYNETVRALGAGGGEVVPVVRRVGRSSLRR